MKKLFGKHRFISVLFWIISIFFLSFLSLFIIFPAHYSTQIYCAAEKYGLSPDFVSAVIWAESRFDARAVSHKGAVGLMQILPSTAEWLSDAEIEPEALKNINLNIDLGCKYLRYLTDKFVDNDLVLAAYNAGEGNVLFWIDNGLEEIPFKETEKYIKKVNAARSIYRFESVFLNLLRP